MEKLFHPGGYELDCPSQWVTDDPVAPTFINIHALMNSQSIPNLDHTMVQSKVSVTMWKKWGFDWNVIKVGPAFLRNYPTAHLIFPCKKDTRKIIRGKTKGFL